MRLDTLDDYWFLEKGDTGYAKYWDLLSERDAIRKFHSLGTPFAWRSNKKSSVVWAQAADLARLHLYKHYHVLAGREVLKDGKGPDKLELYNRLQQEIQAIELQTEDEFAAQFCNLANQPKLF